MNETLRGGKVIGTIEYQHIAPELREELTNPANLKRGKLMAHRQMGESIMLGLIRGFLRSGATHVAIDKKKNLAFIKAPQFNGRNFKPIFRSERHSL